MRLICPARANTCSSLDKPTLLSVSISLQRDLFCFNLQVFCAPITRSFFVYCSLVPGPHSPPRGSVVVLLQHGINQSVNCRLGPSRHCKCLRGKFVHRRTAARRIWVSCARAHQRPKRRATRATPAAPTNQSIAFSDPRGTARRICPCSPRRGLLGRRLRHQILCPLFCLRNFANMQH